MAYFRFFLAVFLSLLGRRLLRAVHLRDYARVGTRSNSAKFGVRNPKERALVSSHSVLIKKVLILVWSRAGAVAEPQVEAALFLARIPSTMAHNGLPTAPLVWCQNHCRFLIN